MKLTVILIAVFMVGCSAQTTVMLADQNLTNEMIAIVSTSENYPDQLTSVKLTKIDNVSVSDKEINTGEIRLTAGRYILTYYVMNSRTDVGWKYAYVDTPTTLTAGNRYQPKVRVEGKSAEVWLEKQ